MAAVRTFAARYFSSLAARGREIQSKAFAGLRSNLLKILKQNMQAHVFCYCAILLLILETSGCVDILGGALRRRAHQRSQVNTFTKYCLDSLVVGSIVNAKLYSRDKTFNRLGLFEAIRVNDRYMYIHKIG